MSRQTIVAAICAAFFSSVITSAAPHIALALWKPPTKVVVKFSPRPAKTSRIAPMPAKPRDYDRVMLEELFKHAAGPAVRKS